MRRTYVPPMAHVLDDERALPRVRRIVSEIHLLSDDSRMLDAARAHVLKGLVQRDGRGFMFRFDAEKGRPDRGPFYVLRHGTLRLSRDKDFSGDAVWLDELTARSLLDALQTMWREELVQRVMGS